MLPRQVQVYESTSPMSIPSLFVHLVSITMFVSTLVTTNLPSQYSWPKYATKCANEYGNDVNNLKVSNPVGLLCGHYQRTCTVTANTDIHVAFDLVTRKPALSVKLEKIWTRPDGTQTTSPTIELFPEYVYSPPKFTRPYYSRFRTVIAQDHPKGNNKIRVELKTDEVVGCFDVDLVIV